jgi:hypothetical protein
VQPSFPPEGVRADLGGTPAGGQRSGGRRGHEQRERADEGGPAAPEQGLSTVSGRRPGPRTSTVSGVRVAALSARVGGRCRQLDPVAQRRADSLRELVGAVGLLEEAGVRRRQHIAEDGVARVAGEEEHG